MPSCQYYYFFVSKLTFFNTGSSSPGSGLTVPIGNLGGSRKPSGGASVSLANEGSSVLTIVTAGAGLTGFTLGPQPSF